jgi:hypothetical protein
MMAGRLTLGSSLNVTRLRAPRRWSCFLCCRLNGYYPDHPIITTGERWFYDYRTGSAVKNSQVIDLESGNGTLG